LPRALRTGHPREALAIEALEARRRRELELERLAGEVANAVAAGRRMVEETVSEERIRLTLVEKGLPKIAEAFAQSFGEIKLTQIGGPGQDPMTMVAGAFERIVDVGRMLGLGAQAAPSSPAGAPARG
jgi:hypothetical protein